MFVYLPGKQHLSVHMNGIKAWRLVKWISWFSGIHAFWRYSNSYILGSIYSVSLTWLLDQGYLICDVNSFINGSHPCTSLIRRGASPLPLAAFWGSMTLLWVTRIICNRKEKHCQSQCISISEKWSTISLQMASPIIWWYFLLSIQLFSQRPWDCVFLLIAFRSSMLQYEKLMCKHSRPERAKLNSHSQSLKLHGSCTFPGLATKISSCLSALLS